MLIYDACRHREYYKSQLHTTFPRVKFLVYIVRNRFTVDNCSPSNSLLLTVSTASISWKIRAQVNEINLRNAGELGY